MCVAVRALALGVALAAIAVPNAMAQATIGVTPEPDECTTVTLTDHQVSGGCELHAVGEVKFDGHLFGFESAISDCETELVMHVGGDGEGYVDGMALTDHSGQSDCTTATCEEEMGETIPWEIHFDEVGAGSEVLEAEVCIDDGTVRSCLIQLPVVVTSTHDYELVFADVAGTNHTGWPNCELDGALHFEGTAFELTHT